MKINTDDVFESIYTAIISNIQKCFGKGSGWIIDSFIYLNINIAKSNPLANSSCNKLPNKLDHTRKRLIRFSIFHQYKFEYNYIYSTYCQPHIKMTVNEHRDFIFQNYFKRTGFSKENYDLIKHQ